VFVLGLHDLSANGQTRKYDNCYIRWQLPLEVAAALAKVVDGECPLYFIEPTDRIGGLTTGGLGQTDIGNKQAIRGNFQGVYENIKKKILR